MHDLRTLRDNLDVIKSQLGPRGRDVAWDDLRALLEERRALSVTVDTLRHELKKGSEGVAKLKREKQSADASMAQMKMLGERIKAAEDSLRAAEERTMDAALRIPKLPHSSVPAGKEPAENQEVRRWGTL